MKHIFTISLCFLALSLSVYGQNNYSMSFDGADDYVDLGNNENFLFQDLFSFEAWVKIPLNPVNSNGAIVNSNGAIIGALNSYRILIYAGNANNGALYVEFPELNPFSGIDVMGSTDLRDNMWHHLAVTYDGAQVVLYVDGLVEDSSDKTGDISQSNAQHSFFIGNSTHVNYEDFHGLISNLGLWKKSLSQQEIQYYMSCPLTGDEEGLVGYWNFEEGVGSTAYDMYNGNDGTINGATWSTDVPEQSCQSDCTDFVACNYNPDATDDDGSCDYSCCPGPGCCTEGMYWDWELSGCYNINPADINLDGCVQLNDLLDLLGAYGDCFVPGYTSCGDDIEHQGYNYATVQIGDQCWFAENCRYLPAVSHPSESSETSPYYYVYGYQGTDLVEAKATENYETYGVLYNWSAAITEGLCPSGWHVPSDGEWQTMEISLGMNEADASSEGWRGSPVGDYMKSTTGWSNNGNGSNSSGFNGLPGGSIINGGFNYYGDYGDWWSASESDSYSWLRTMNFGEISVRRGYDNRANGFSARCIKD